MGMHADCGHGLIMATSIAQLHMQVMTSWIHMQTTPLLPLGMCTRNNIVHPNPPQLVIAWGAAGWVDRRCNKWCEKGDSRNRPGDDGCAVGALPQRLHIPSLQIRVVSSQ